MRRILLISFLCLLAVATTGCKKAQLRRQLKELMGSTIVLPEKITCVYNGEVYPMPDSLRDKAKMIVYIDSSECQTCRLSQLALYGRLYDMTRETNSFAFLFLLGNTSFGQIPLTRYLADQDYSFPVFIDDRSCFLMMNAVVPKSTIFHSLFLSPDNRVEFVGDPIRNPNIMTFLERYTNLNHIVL